MTAKDRTMRYPSEHSLPRHALLLGPESAICSHSCKPSNQDSGREAAVVFLRPRGYHDHGYFLLTEMVPPSIIKNDQSFLSFLLQNGACTSFFLRANLLKGTVMKTDTRLFSHLPGGVKVRSLLALAVILLAAWLIVESPLFHKTAPPGVHLSDLHSVGQFQKIFNADTGMPRLVLILSPT